jgi:hypothetical protein
VLVSVTYINHILKHLAGQVGLVSLYICNIEDIVGLNRREHFKHRGKKTIPGCIKFVWIFSVFFLMLTDR